MIAPDTLAGGELVKMQNAPFGRVEVTLAVPADVAAEMTLGHWYEPVSTDAIVVEGWQSDGSLYLGPAEAAAVRDVLQSVVAEAAGKLRKISHNLGAVIAS